MAPLTPRETIELELRQKVIDAQTAYYMARARQDDVVCQNAMWAWTTALQAFVAAVLPPPQRE